MTTPYFKKAILALAIIQLAACSGSSGGSDNKTPDNDQPSDQQGDTTPTDPNSVSGVLVDPYIAEAKVFLDLNNNGKFDPNEPANEPSTETDSEGKFTFELGEPLANNTKVFTLNRGSFQQPDYGYHAGIPYQLQLSAEIPAGDSNVVVTPASTAAVSLGIPLDTLADIINQFSEKIGKTLTAADLTADPFANLPANAVDPDALASLRANLVIYSLLRTLDAMAAIDPSNSIGTFFSQQAQDSTSKAYEVMSTIVTAISDGISEELINGVRQGIDDGNTQLANNLPAGIVQPPMPDISTEVIMSTAAAIANLFIDKSSDEIIKGLATHNTGDFVTDFNAIADDVITAMQTLSTSLQDGVLVGELGTKTYGAVNKAHFDAYYPQVRDGIFAASPLLKEGYDCKAGHIAIGNTFNDDFTATTQGSVCASALPKQVSEQVGAAQRNAENDPSADIETDMWANLPIGSLRVSDVAEGCTFEGYVKYENGDAVPFVPMYMAFPTYNLEMYVQTDAQGKFEFTNMPVGGKFGLQGDESNVPDPQYFVGTYAGVHSAHPHFKDKESVSDFNVECFKAGDVYTLNPIMKAINDRDNTRIKGTIDKELLGEGFGIEIHSIVAANTLQLNSKNQPRRAWIMNTIQVEDDYNQPHMDFDATDGSYEKRALAGGDYVFRVTVGAIEGRESFGFDVKDEHVIKVVSGQTTTANLEVDLAAQTYTLTVNGTPYSGSIANTVPIL